jgi:hypothetical protein
MTRAEMVLETLIFSAFNHLTQLLAREHVVAFSCHDPCKLSATDAYETLAATCLYGVT